MKKKNLRDFRGKKTDEKEEKRKRKEEMKNYLFIVSLFLFFLLS